MQTKVYPTRAQNDEQMQISAQITLQCILMGKTSWNLSRRFPWIERASQPENTLYMDPVVWKSYPLNLLLAMYMFIIFERNYHRKLLPKIGCNYLLPFWNCDIFFTAIKIRILKICPKMVEITSLYYQQHSHEFARWTVNVIPLPVTW
jgi:hypothetical protein